MTDDSPDRPPPIKVGSLQGFLPLIDPTVTTRGQNLPGLIQQRSALSVHDFKKRRHITIEDDKDGEGGDVERRGNGVDFRPDGSQSLRRILSKGERRGSALSEVSQIMNTPQMRSMRLIGHSNNPRYEWYVN